MANHFCQLRHLLGNRFYVDYIMSAASDCKTHRYIRIAYERGYRMDGETGEVISPTGYRRPVTAVGKQRYPSFAITITEDGKKRTASFMTHKFAAYCYFGEDAFTHHVRHLHGDRNNLRRADIALGSPSENEMDKPAAVRTASAKKARASQDTSPAAKLTPDQVKWILSRPMSTRKMAEALNVCRATIQKVIRGITYAG